MAETEKNGKTIPLRARYASLTGTQRVTIARALLRGLRKTGAFGRGGYKVVYGPDQRNRPRISAETGGETEQLTANERNRLISFARNAARNSDRLEGILHQVEINVIGVNGGKAVFEFPEPFREKGDLIKEAFAEWAQEAEYFEDADLQDTLKKLLRTQLLGGDCVVVFDDGITSRSTGQVIAFEPDCIGDLDNFSAYYPNYTQIQGIVKDEGKTIGVTVSWMQRGQASYSREIGGKLAAWTLIKPEGSWKNSPFIIYSDSGRFNQVRGSSRLWPGLGTVADISDTQGFEVQASKLGAQKIGQILQQDSESGKTDLAAELDPDAESPIGVEGVDAGAADGIDAGEAADDREKLDLETIDGAGILWDILPPNVKMELFDTKHPNDKLVEFSKWLHGGVAFAIGLGRASATGEANSSYSASMMELLLSQIEYEDEFHKLEKRFLDWLFNNWSKWAQRKRIIPQDSELPPNWRRKCVKWQRPKPRAIDPVKHQTALTQGLRNGSILYRDEWGPDWKDKADAFAEELDYFKSKNIPHPALVTVSGAPISTGKNEGESEE